MDGRPAGGSGPPEPPLDRLANLRAVAELAAMRGDDPDAPFLVFGDRRIGFGSFFTMANSASAVLADALAAGVAFVPGAAFHPEGIDDHRMRLCFTTLTPAQLDEAARRLGEAISGRASGASAPGGGRRRASTSPGG